MADEVELKLELTSEAADAIEASGVLAGDPETARQKSIYFDTPDRDLAKHGLSLRIRWSDGKRVQTIKANGASGVGLFTRSEWERPVADDTPILDDATPVRALLGDDADALAPVFEVDIERRIWIISEQDTTIELVIDRGKVVAGERRTPICEIELELKQGDPATLFALAHRLDAVAPVRLGVQAKAARGYALLGPASTMAKAGRIDLSGEMTAAQAFRRIVQSCLLQFRLNEALLATGRHAGALHQARVALRRLRSAFTIFKPLTGDADADLRDGLRWLASEFGDARNLDVLLERAGPGSFRDRLAGAREAAYDRVDTALASSRARQLMIDLAQRTSSEAGLDWADREGDGNPPVRAFAAKALRRFYGKVKKGGRDLADADDRARHEVRKDAKKLRYATEFFEGLFERRGERRRYKDFAVALEVLQDRLGAINDLAIAPDILGKLGIADDPDAAKLLSKGRKKSLIEGAERASKDLFDVKRFWR